MSEPEVTVTAEQDEKVSKEKLPPRDPKVVWEDLLMQVETASLDARKNMEKGNASAGVRLRASLRKVKALCSELVRSTMDADALAKKARIEKRLSDKK